MVYLQLSNADEGIGWMVPLISILPLGISTLSMSNNISLVPATVVEFLLLDPMLPHDLTSEFLIQIKTPLSKL
jgi:hypothetical protein